jgi:hypothetical protein
MDLQQRIDLGTQFLDAVRPGWANQIDLDSLDLENPRACVLGQVFAERAAEYDNVSPFVIGGWAAHDWLVEQGYQLNDESDEYFNAAKACGFERDGVTRGWPFGEDTYDELQAAWTQVIESLVA